MEPSGACKNEIERSIKEDLESADSIRSDQEHIGAIRSILERSGACKSEIERSIKEDLESAGSIRSDQEHIGASRSILEQSGAYWSDQEQSWPVTPETHPDFRLIGHPLKL